MPRRARAKHAISFPRGGARDGVQLAWARDREGRKVRASRLAPADRRGLGPFTCLGCGEQLIPHLGRIRTPHFAHRPGSTCPLTAPETALHLDAKERLLALCQEAFAGRRRLRALARCPACRRVTPVDVGAIGDEAEAEGTVGPLRADVLVRSGGRPALAIEIRVTHAVEPEKEAALGAAGVPAVEVDACEEWEREGPAAPETVEWRAPPPPARPEPVEGRASPPPARPEPVEGRAPPVDILCARSLGFAPCPACRARARADDERDWGGEPAEIAELEAYRARGLWGAPGSELPPAGQEVDAPLTEAERARIRARFRCPDCGGTGLDAGARLLRHRCPAAAGSDRAARPERPVAWRGYDGSLVTLRWWSARRPPPAVPGPRAARKRP